MIERVFQERIPRDESTEENRLLWRAIEAAAAGLSASEPQHSRRELAGHEHDNESGDSHYSAGTSKFG